MLFPVTLVESPVRGIKTSLSHGDRSRMMLSNFSWTEKRNKERVSFGIKITTTFFRDQMISELPHCKDTLLKKTRGECQEGNKQTLTNGAHLAIQRKSLTTR